MAACEQDLAWMYEMLQDLWDRTGSVDDAYEEISGYIVGMNSAQSPRVPEKISDYGYPDYGEVWGYYKEGWNDCIDEMLASAPKQSHPVPEVGAMADALGDALRRKHAVFLARTKLEDLVRAMLESAPKPGGDS